MKASKPKKTNSDFPLTANGNGRRSKWEHGKVHYFGVWADPQAAYDEFERQRHYLYEGMEVPTKCDTLGDVVKKSVEDKKASLESGKIVRESYSEYVAICEVINTLGEHRPIDCVTPFDLKKLNHNLAIRKRGQTRKRRAVCVFSLLRAYRSRPRQQSRAF